MLGSEIWGAGRRRRAREKMIERKKDRGETGGRLKKERDRR